MTLLISVAISRVLDLVGAQCMLIVQDEDNKLGPRSLVHGNKQCQ